MPGAFGFEPFPQRPSADPRQVGAALAQRRMAPPMPSALAAAPGPAVGTISAAAGSAQDRLHQLFRMLAQQGGHETSGGGQTGTGSAPPGDPDYAVAENEAHSAMHAAVGDAATRLANGAMRNAQVGDQQRERRRAHLLRLGIAPFEADLLSRSGGI